MEKTKWTKMAMFLIALGFIVTLTQLWLGRDRDSESIVSIAKSGNLVICVDPVVFDDVDEAPAKLMVNMAMLVTRNSGQDLTGTIYEGRIVTDGTKKYQDFSMCPAVAIVKDVNKVNRLLAKMAGNLPAELSQEFTFEWFAPYEPTPPLSTTEDLTPKSF